MLTKCIKGLTQHLLGFPKLSRDVPSTILCSSMGDVYIGINTGGGEISVATNLTPQAVTKSWDDLLDSEELVNLAYHTPSPGTDLVSMYQYHDLWLALSLFVLHCFPEWYALLQTWTS